MDGTPAGDSSSTLRLQNILLLPKASPLVDLLTTPLPRPTASCFPHMHKAFLLLWASPHTIPSTWPALMMPSAILKLSFRTPV